MDRHASVGHEAVSNVQDQRVCLGIGTNRLALVDDGRRPAARLRLEDLRAGSDRRHPRTALLHTVRSIAEGTTSPVREIKAGRPVEAISGIDTVRHAQSSEAAGATAAIGGFRAIRERERANPRRGHLEHPGIVGGSSAVASHAFHSGALGPTRGSRPANPPRRRVLARNRERACCPMTAGNREAMEVSMEPFVPAAQLRKEYVRNRSGRKRRLGGHGTRNRVSPYR